MINNLYKAGHKVIWIKYEHLGVGIIKNVERYGYVIEFPDNEVRAYFRDDELRLASSLELALN